MVKRCRCSSEGGANQVVKGGVCIKHTAKIALKVCSSNGYKNCAQKEGVCRRLGAKRLRSSYAAVMDAQIKPSVEEAWGKGANYVALMDVQIKSSKEEFA
jgi:hypothetical protein